MILNPWAPLDTIPGLRRLWDGRGLEGLVVQDPRRRRREWRLLGLYAPVHRYGVRARCVDSRGVIAFINQRDLEHLLGHGDSGEECCWLGENYVAPGERGWVGFGMDDPADYEDHWAETPIPAELGQWGVVECLFEVAGKTVVDRRHSCGVLIEQEVVAWDSLSAT